MERTKKIRRPVFQLISLGFVARVLSIINGFLLIKYIAPNYDMDIHSLGTSWMVFMGMIVEGLILSLILVYQEIEIEQGIEGRFKFTNDLINLMIIISIGLMVTGYILAPMLVKSQEGNFSSEGISQAIGLFRIGTAVIVFHFIRGVSGGYLQGDNRFLAGAKAGVAYGIIYMICLLIFKDRLGLEGLVILGLLAVVGQAYVLAKPLFKDGYRYRFDVNLRNKRYGRLMGFLIPILIYIVIGYLNTKLVNGFVSREIGEGAFALGYAKKIIDFVYGLSLWPIATVLFPILAWDFKEGDMEELGEDIDFGVNILSKLGILISLVLLIFARPIVQIIYGRKGFNMEEIVLIAWALRFYTLGLWGMGLSMLTIRIYYAIHDTITPIGLGLFSLGLNLVLNRLLVDYIGSGGVALAASITSVVMPILGIYILDKRSDIIAPKTFRILWNILLGQ